MSKIKGRGCKRCEAKTTNGSRCKNKISCINILTVQNTITYTRKPIILENLQQDQTTSIKI